MLNLYMNNKFINDFKKLSINLLLFCIIYFLISYINIFGFSYTDFIKLKLIDLKGAFFIYFFCSVFIHINEKFNSIAIDKKEKSHNFEYKIPMLAGIIECSIIIALHLYILPTIFNTGIINIGNGQATFSTNNHFERFFLLSILAPLYEEFWCRVTITKICIAIYCMISFFIIPFGKYITNAYNLKSFTCWLFIILNSIFFTYQHGTDMSNFLFYFIPSIIFSVIYIKYGFFSAFIAHGTSNAISLLVSIYLI